MGNQFNLHVINRQTLFHLTGRFLPRLDTMATPARPRYPTEIPGLEWLVTDDGSHTLWMATVDESFHSGCGAVGESLVVYLAGSGVLSRLERGLPTRVLEVGLGTATAFLMTAAAAEHYQVSLHYTALENQLLPAAVFERLHADRLAQLASASCHTNSMPGYAGCFDRLAECLQRFLDRLPLLLAGSAGQQISLSEWVTLEVVLGDASRFAERAPATSPGYDAIYFDPFSPEKAAELWTLEQFQGWFRLLAEQGTLTSYCVKSRVRQQLKEVGFDVRRVAGPVGGKREVLLASKPAGP